MSFYSLLLVIHIIAAVCGLGATFAMPVLMSMPKTVSQAKFAMAVSVGIEKLAKIGSITLLLTGLIMGFISPTLFKQGWFIASIVIYIGVQPIVAFLLPKYAKQQASLLEQQKDDQLPSEYLAIGEKMKHYNIIAQISAIILIILMTIKPF
ncbi:DUF2269 family protein [Peribacillus acanthi]|uniref:DUF2269 family protein n=1 Tax=Peribacillus acanthi TaxID=2171554 RepID=UPI000D3EAA12|nr:DUF2269 family protein [Peribacillus acanthi]